MERPEELGCPPNNEDCKYYKQGCRENLAELVSAKIIHRRHNRLLERPPKPHTIIYTSCRHTIGLTPFAGSFSDAIDCFKSGSRHVRHLLFLCRPLTIAGFVVTVAINSINRMFSSGFLPHIRKKVSESVFTRPLLTYLYPSTTISVISMIFRRITTFYHSSPRVVLFLMNIVTTMCSTRVIQPSSLTDTKSTPATGRYIESALVLFKDVATLTLNRIHSVVDFYDRECALVNTHYNNSITGLCHG